MSAVADSAENVECSVPRKDVLPCRPHSPERIKERLKPLALRNNWPEVRPTRVANQNSGFVSVEQLAESNFRPEHAPGRVSLRVSEPYRPWPRLLAVLERNLILWFVENDAGNGFRHRPTVLISHSELLGGSVDDVPEPRRTGYVQFHLCALAVRDVWPLVVEVGSAEDAVGIGAVNCDNDAVFCHQESAYARKLERACNPMGF